MTNDEIVADRLAAIFLDSADVQNQMSVVLKYERSFGKSDIDRKQVERVISAMLKDGRLIEHDVENDTLDGVIIDHVEHGQLDNKDITFLSVDELLAIGPGMMSYARSRASYLAEQASEGGLSTALRLLNDLPIDSSLWTGMPAGFKLDDKTKVQVIKLIHRADNEISTVSVSNRDVAQAKALITAALVLAEAPEPENEIIWGLLQKLSVFVTLSQGVEGLIKFFKAI